MDLALPIAILGPSSSGKTAIIHSFTNNQNQIFPTAGLQISYLTTSSQIILAYDCSGEGSSRNNWQQIGALVDSVIYVIDAHNTVTFATAKQYLYTFLQKNKFMRKKNLCVMLNKCDLKNRPSKQIIVKALQIERLSKLVSKYYVKQTSAYSKQGLDECFEWIIKNNAKNSDDN